MSTPPHSNGQYNSQVVELFDRTPFAGRMEPSLGVFVGTAGSPVDGTEVHFWLKAGGGRIQAISFRAYGCPHTIAAAAWVAQHARGLALGEVENTQWLEVERALAVPPQKRGRLLIVEDALKAAVKAAVQNV
ncbi:MAG TPA: iron-sulfur cluster assembly scaffold protein [Steroidobacteraceae bacterium]|nr:iron-sulfur cluster assembly scaffold protein [Steroidobacteraceae bacterium]